MDNGSRVNLNKSGLEEISKLPQIGELKAKEIVDHRPYRCWEDLKRKVPSIDERLLKILQKQKDRIDFEL
ncbi:helix-hairpin-helix domain-containing protein [Chitinispirillales bacterium ANBcel5]|uniref:ComEA family DNA-binding protein n=1 Tax=Cellulosispirillum alkaliphilum TaxID=3039283 RepID=UPI002A52A7EC|nr:helix-hairpin-helix domain-containing protein [Chitinispirillales bacterium ANBcel5]